MTHIHAHGQGRRGRGSKSVYSFLLLLLVLDLAMNWNIDLELCGTAWTYLWYDWWGGTTKPFTSLLQLVQIFCLTAYKYIGLNLHGPIRFQWSHGLTLLFPSVTPNLTNGIYANCHRISSLNNPSPLCSGSFLGLQALITTKPLSTQQDPLEREPQTNTDKQTIASICHLKLALMTRI